MKTFFFMPQSLRCNSSCNYLCCPHKYLHSLQELGALRSMAILDGSCRNNDRLPDVMPQHGDIVIMFAGDKEDLELMISNEERFECARKILVLGYDAEIDTSRCHQLGPRFITHMDRSVDELEAVILRMQDRTARTLQTMGMQL